MWNFAASITILLLFFTFMYVMLRNAGGWTRCSGCGRKIRKENIRVMKTIWTDKLVWRCPKCGHYNLDARDRKDCWR